MSLRCAFPVLVALLAATPSLAQKPTVDATDPISARYRDRALAVCVVDLAAVERFTAETRESVCGCAVGRFMQRWPTGALPMLEGVRVPPTMAGDLVACASEEDPRLAAAVARRLSQTPAAPAPAAVAPIDKPRAAPEEERRSSPRSKPGLFDGLSWPSWLTDPGLPVWALIPLALFVLLFLRGLARRSEEKDLLGPPSSMRRTQAAPPRRP